MWDEKVCDSCGDPDHSTEQHDMTPQDANISHQQWGTLFHGTPYKLEGDVIDPARFKSGAMPGAHGTFATTSRLLAESYAQPNAHTIRHAEQHGLTIQPTVHEVVPHPDDHGPFDYEIDPNSGSNGWQDAPHILALKELNSYGEDEHSMSGASLMFPGRLLSKRQHRIEE